MILRAGCFKREAVQAGLVLCMSLGLGACGINLTSKKAALQLDVAKAEFADPAWISVRKGTRAENRYPGVRINLARVTPHSEASLRALPILQGDRIWIGINVRGSVQDPPLVTGWQQVGSVSQVQDYFQELALDTLILPNGKSLEADQEYVLALRITRGFEQSVGSKVIEVLNVSPFTVDTRQVESAAATKPAYGLTPNGTLAARHRNPAFPFSVSCRFTDPDGNPRPVRAGDVAYVSFFGLRISEVMDLSGYAPMGDGSGLYRFTIPVDTTGLPESSDMSTNSSGRVRVNCETSAGTTHAVGLAAGVDYTPPDLSITKGTGLGAGANLSVSGHLTFIGSCLRGSEVVLDVVTASSSTGQNKALPAQGFVTEALPGYVTDCLSLTEGIDGNDPQTNTGFKLSLNPKRPAAPGGYVVRVRALDFAGNESIQFLPVSVLVQVEQVEMVDEVEAGL